MTIFVGSQNPVKINAVVTAASETWPNVQVQGLNIPSGISDQPISDEETKLGAENRALKALEDGLLSSDSATQKEALGIGLEGGFFVADDDTVWNTVWGAVADPKGNLFSVSGSRFELKEPLASALKSGKELGPFMSSLTGFSEVNQKQGMIGVITNGFIDRTEAYSGLAKLAIGLWYGRNWQVAVRTGEG